MEVGPVEVVQTRSSAKKANAPSSSTTTGNVTPRQQHQLHNNAPPHNDAAPVQAHNDAPLPIVPNEANAIRFAAWAAKNKTDYETNKQECIKAFHSFPEQFLQLSSDKTKHIELGTVYHRAVDDEIIVVTGRTQMNDCKFQKAVYMGKYPASYAGALTQTL
jgi:hypothetical protein